MDEDEGMETIWIERSRRNSRAAARAERGFFTKLDAHKAKVGPCPKCDFYLSQGLAALCPEHEPDNDE